MHPFEGTVPLPRHLGTAREDIPRLRFDRCMWGTDWTRAVNLLTYQQGVEAFRVTDELSDAERCDADGRNPPKYLQMVTSDRELSTLPERPFSV